MTQVKETVVVSGKGGTGKTSFTGALSTLFSDKVVADCDVDAANLHLILNPEWVFDTKEFVGGKKAVIDLARCTGCGVCQDVCSYGAISSEFVIDSVACEGCGACYFFCPAKAIDFSPRLAGHCFVSRTAGNGTFVFAELLPGEENSGKLVAMVRTEARAAAEKEGKALILIDGPPGIGCSVISSLTGAHVAIVVTEPTPTGVHDLRRIVQLIEHFRIKTAVVLNKSDISPYYAEEVQLYCKQKGVVYLGDIPYDTRITEAQRAGKNILDFDPDCGASASIRSIYTKLQQILEEV